MEKNYEITELNKLVSLYEIIAPFLTKCKRINYVQFDYYVVNDLTLFTIDPDFDFSKLEETLDNIIHILPAVKRIFSKPVLHLRQENEILPVEAVRLITNETIQHIAGHSELWSDVNEKGIKPVKLLTRTYQDNYGIYENLVFCKAIDDILAYVRKNIRIVQNLIYTNRTIEINYLERVNHLNYFLALGKLHTGYNRNFDSYYNVSIHSLNKLQFILNTIVPRLRQPVYKNNKNKPKNISLHKTNILSMHKDYHQIYSFLKGFTNKKNEEEEELKDFKVFQKNYFNFCQILCLFSIGHFNFKCDEKKLISFSKLNVKFTYKDWKLDLKKESFEDVSYLLLKLEKELTYQIILFPSVYSNSEEKLLKLSKEVQADEYLICTPFDKEESTDCLISLSDIESFRRIQQILLRGMVYTDVSRKDCPFCNNRLSLNLSLSTEEYPVYECGSCRTNIMASYCPTTNKNYYYTKIANYEYRPRPKSFYSLDEVLFQKREKEGAMFYRNITELNSNLEIVCPHCRQVHKEKTY